LDHGFEIMLRLEPDEFSYLLDVRAAPAHVLEAQTRSLFKGSFPGRESPGVPSTCT
jgi:hypothetical protein